MTMDQVAEVSTEYVAGAEENAVPVGYKQTEVGVIPEDWGIKNIGEIAFVFSGGTPNRKIAEYWNGRVPWVTTTLIDGGKINSAREFITQKGVEGSSAKWCKAGTILLAMYGQGKTRGKAALLSIDSTINQACAAIELKEASSSQYILHVLNSMYEDIRELSNSGGQENLNGQIIKSIQILLPSKKEQTAIANALSDVDALISEQEKLIAKKQAIKTATMQQLLTGRTRLPQFALREDGTPKSIKPSELGEIPEDWEIVCLSDCGVFQSGNGFPTKYQGNKEGWYPFFKVSDMNNTNNTKFLKRSNNYISEEIRSIISAKIIAEKSIVFAKIGAAIFLERKRINIQPACIDNNMMAYLASEDKLYYEYAYLLFMNMSFGELAEATALPSLSGKDIGQRKFYLPGFEEQLNIAAILSDMDEEIQALEQRLSKTRQIKQGMMQQLLTGKTRLVPSATREIGNAR